MILGKKYQQKCALLQPLQQNQRKSCYQQTRYLILVQEAMILTTWEIKDIHSAKRLNSPILKIKPYLFDQILITRHLNRLKIIIQNQNSSKIQSAKSKRTKNICKLKIASIIISTEWIFESKCSRNNVFISRVRFPRQSRKNL